MYISCDSLFGEEEGFFTREDFSEYIEYPLTDMFKQDFGIDANFRCYCDDNKTIETDCDFNGSSFTIYTTVDFRKIRKPSDLENYAYIIYRQIIEEYGDYVGIE